MMDQFWEEAVVKQKKASRAILIAACNGLMVLFALFGFVFLNSTINAVFSVGFGAAVLPLVVCVVCIAGAVFLFINKDKLHTEYMCKPRRMHPPVSHRLYS